MKKQILSFLAGAIIIILLAATPQIQSVVFKPQRPASVYVQEFGHSEHVAQDICEYINRKLKEGYIVKSITMCGTSYNGGETGIVVMEKY